MHRRTYLMLLIPYKLNSRCSGRSDIKAIGQQYLSHRISFRFYINWQESNFSSVAKSTKNSKKKNSPMRFFHIFKMLEKR